MEKLYVHQSEVHEIVQISDKLIVIYTNMGEEIHISTEILDYGYDSKLRVNRVVP